MPEFELQGREEKPKQELSDRALRTFTTILSRKKSIELRKVIKKSGLPVKVALEQMIDHCYPHLKDIDD